MPDHATRPSAQNGRRFDRAATLALVFALLILLTSTAQLIYRYFLPTDGWLSVADDLNSAELLYFANLVGALRACWSRTV